jgi:hypothetical protein
MARYNMRNNCMAYALGRATWMLPRYWEAFAATDEPSIEWKMIKRMEKDFNLKPVTKEEMVLGKEYIAFRIAWYPNGDVDDFHFIKRHKTGHWTHKQGGHPVKGISQKIVFSDVWRAFGNINYTGTIYLFEVL